VTLETSTPTQSALECLECPGVPWSALEYHECDIPSFLMRVPERTGGQQPPALFMPFEAPHLCGVVWNEQRGVQHPLCHL
jgi:hypothetical protein